MKAPEPVVIYGVLWKPYAVNHIDAAIEEAIWRRYNGEQQRHFCLVKRENMIAVVQDRDNKYPNAMWTTRNFLG
ncbi:hypothetical protein QA055_gp18 [Salmonella phage CTH7]|uniref:Uncharacterized protein n=1 Tax=Salmonella phage CTH7 TaxID=2950460 RepID=A0A9E7MP36_9CAUD|nr:hypothetical protein QA055_gp18 [Salmonella phage CTH7]URQ02891.1 hypothetical protein [Salmonella phage PST-H1]USL89568.1 hypothetical protein [Salmonella phage nctD30]USL89697.1 hypothetical protein [Salmonella phage pse-D34]UTQ79628.1 hypothetical protein [Salmonella phage NCTh5]USL89638.1 hypothetical protein [Salmonella phage CTH7]